MAPTRPVRRGNRIRALAAAGALSLIPSGHRLPYTTGEIVRMPRAQLTRIHPEKILDTLQRSKPSERDTLLRHLPISQLSKLPRRELVRAPTRGIIDVLFTRTAKEREIIPTEAIALLARISTARTTPSATLIEVEESFHRALQQATQTNVEYWSGGSLGKGTRGFQQLDKLDRVATLIYGVKNGKLLMQKGIAQTTRMRREVARDIHYFAVFQQRATPEQLARLAEKKITPEGLKKEIEGN